MSREVKFRGKSINSGKWVGGRTQKERRKQ